MNLSVFYGKRCESTSGKKGYVISVNSNAEKLECLICADENEKEFAVDIKNIISVGEVILYEDRESAIKSARPVKLGRAGFDENGKYLGNMEDFTFDKGKLIKAKIGNKYYSADELIFGDVILVKPFKKLKYDVIKDGKTIIKKGTTVTTEILRLAEKEGEYVQTYLKSL